jgi:hypothetical protein
MSSEDALPAIDAEAVPWLSVEEMREVDRIIVDELGISLVRMMENAGRNLAQLARHLLGWRSPRLRSDSCPFRPSS